MDAEEMVHNCEMLASVKQLRESLVGSRESERLDRSLATSATFGGFGYWMSCSMPMLRARARARAVLILGSELPASIAATVP